MKVLIACIYPPDKVPGQRFRFEQYLDFLNSKGVEIVFSNALSEADYKLYYSKGHLFQKMMMLVKGFCKRMAEVLKASDYDIVFVYREAFFIGTSWFEKQFAKKSNLIFDFDDSIWIPTVSEGNKSLNFLKNPNKTNELLQMAALIFAGNQYLANYAGQLNKNVAIIPTTIDTKVYQPKKFSNKAQVCIGWSGSFSTVPNFEGSIPVLLAIKKKYGNNVYFKLIGDGNFKNEELGINGIPWTKENEIEELSEIDIGIMPLPNDAWANGKCGLKGLQYMALSIPTIMSPVGVNKEIIKDGENGFLATTENEWVDKLSSLIDSIDLRKNIGEKGRETVVNHYSVDAIKPLYLQYFEEVGSLMPKQIT